MKLATTSFCPPQRRNPVLYRQQKIPDVYRKRDARKISRDFPKIGGLENLGNTCFFNATLQCLAQTPFLTKVLGDLCQPAIGRTLDNGITSILYKTLTEMQRSGGQESYWPTELFESFRKRKPEYLDGRQHDSHELLRQLLELVRSEHHTDDKLLSSELVFGGVMVSTLECLECHDWSQRTEPFMDISLSIVTNDSPHPNHGSQSSGLKTTFNLMDFVVNTSNGPSKSQLKREKKAARKCRKNRRHQNFKESSTSQQNDVDRECADKIEGIFSDLDANEFQSAQIRLEENTMVRETKSNGMNEVTLSPLKVGINGSMCQMPSRYRIKEGECSIRSCLNEFTALELMSGSNKIGCEACTARESKYTEASTKMVCTPSSKQYLISRAPPVLILHLKRFQEERPVIRKITKSVDFPAVLDLTPVCKGRGEPRIYELYGVVEHSGDLQGGHYVAYVKARQQLSSDDTRWSFLSTKDTTEMMKGTNSWNSESESGAALAGGSSLTANSPPSRWYHVSDSRVMEVDETTVLRSQAYMLFYERIL